MNTMADNETFDYQANMREVPPDPTQIRRGTAELERRRTEAALRYQSVRIERENFEQFHQLAVNGQSAEQLINQALREWLAAQGIKEMVRAEIQLAVRQTFSAAAFQPGTPSV
jgi:hypothetical protein